MGCRVLWALFLAGSSVSWVLAQVPAGGEFQVNTYTTNDQASPSVTSDAAGNFVVTWYSYGQDGSGAGIFARRYDSGGAPRGGEFQVNAYTTEVQILPAASSDAVGNFVVAWQSYGQDGSYDGIFAQCYQASGAPRASELQVNTYTTDRQRAPAIASDPAGNFVVTWTSYGQDGSQSGVFAQRFDAAGAPRGVEFQVNTYTTANQDYQRLTADAAGDFVVVWTSAGQDGSSYGAFGQRYDATGTPRGAEFQINSYTTSAQAVPAVASDPAGNFVVVWQSNGPDGSYAGVVGQRYDATGTPRGAQFQVNTYTSDSQYLPAVASDAAGDFVVTWTSNKQDGSDGGIFARRFDASGVPRGAEFQINTYTTGRQTTPSVVSDAVGNFVVAWTSYGQDGSYTGVFARRFGGLEPAALAVDTAGNGVLEPGETVAVEPSWKNVNGTTQTFDGTGLSFAGPAASGVSYSLPDGAATYGCVPDGGTAQCSDCYQVGVGFGFGGTRPATHWDATFTERVTPDSQGQTKRWTLHVGESFTDVPKTSSFYKYVETLLHRGVTAGCSTDTYCPTSSTSRQQMTVFALLSKEGPSYAPPACGIPLFADVPASSPYCKWIEELARRGVVGGCGGGNFCPTSAVSREQMAVFALRTLDPGLNPPDCGTPMFDDVPAGSPYCKWIEELARRGVVGGCGGSNYCPTSPVTRGQMGVFLSLTFGLSLYGP